MAENHHGGIPYPIILDDNYCKEQCVGLGACGTEAIQLTARRSWNQRRPEKPRTDPANLEIFSSYSRPFAVVFFRPLGRFAVGFGLRFLSLSVVGRENIESGSTVGLSAHWCIGEDQGCSRVDDCTEILQKGRID